MTSFKMTELRVRLSPLVAAEPILADRLSGGLKVSGSGKGGVFVRSGWQTTTIGKGKSRAREPGSSPNLMDTNELVEDVANMLTGSKEDIIALRSHPHVRKLIEKKRLRLEEWAE